MQREKRKKRREKGREKGRKGKKSRKEEQGKRWGWKNMSQKTRKIKERERNGLIETVKNIEDKKYGRIER